MTSGAIQHGVPTNVCLDCSRVKSLPVASQALTPKSVNAKTTLDSVSQYRYTDLSCTGIYMYSHVVYHTKAGVLKVNKTYMCEDTTSIKT